MVGYEGRIVMRLEQARVYRGISVAELSRRMIQSLPHEETAADHPIGHDRGEERQDDAADDQELPPRCT